MPSPIKNIPIPQRNVEFQVDTLVTSDAVGYFSPNRNSVTKNYFENRIKTASGDASPLLAHEEKHHDNHLAGMKQLSMSLEEYYKVCCHDEISATICELLQTRHNYLKADDKGKRDIENIYGGEHSEFSFWFDAVKSGKINPQSSQPQDIDGEMSFIANGTRDMWMKNFSSSYDDEHISMTRYYMNTHDYEQLRPNPHNYDAAINIAYNIGGIDFSTYMDKDIDLVNPRVKTADQKIAASDSRNNVLQDLYSDNDDQTEKLVFPDLKNIEGLSLQQQYKLSQHVAFMETLKRQNGRMLREVSAETLPRYTNFDELVQDLTKQTSENITQNAGVKAQWESGIKRAESRLLKDRVNIPDGDEKIYQSYLAKVYDYRGIDFRKYMPHDVEQNITSAKSTRIEDFEKKNWLQRLQNYTSNTETARSFRSMFSGKEQKPQPTTDDTKAAYNGSYYTGEAKYYSWSSEKRVSPVQKQEIVDFNKPFLKQQIMPENNNLESLVSSNRKGHFRIQEMREKLAQGHTDKFELLKDNTNVTVDHLRQLRYEQASKGTTRSPQSITAELLKKQLNEMILNQ